MKVKIKNPLVKKIKNWKAHEIYYNLIKPSTDLGKKFKCKEFSELTFDEVEYLKLHTSEMDEVLKIFYGDKFDIKKIRVYNLFAFQKWLTKELERIIEREKMLDVTDVKLTKAGINNLGKFKGLNAKIALGEQFSINPSEVGTWLNDHVFTLLLHNKTVIEIKNNLRN